MRLIQTKTGRELSPGDKVELRGDGAAYIHSLHPAKNRVMVTPEEDDRRGNGSIMIHPAAIDASYL